MARSREAPRGANPSGMGQECPRSHAGQRLGRQRLKARVARRELPGENCAPRSPTPTGLRPSCSANGRNPVGVGTLWRGSPRVASRTRQPWAGGRNPFGIGARALPPHDGRSALWVATFFARLRLRYRPAPPLNPKGIPPQSPAIAEITRGFPFSYCPIHPIRICFGFRASDFGFPPPPVCALQISAV